MTTYKMHTCLRRLRFSYLVVRRVIGSLVICMQRQQVGVSRAVRGKDSILAFDDIRYEKDSVLI